MNDDLISVSPEFLAEGKKLCQTMPKSKKEYSSGGPYSSQNKQIRRNEVYRYHFDYGYSARKISEILKINRNTINGDVKYWYSKIRNTNSVQNPESIIMTMIERLDIQRSRLREHLEKLKDTQNKIQIEKLIYDIDCKIAQIFQKLSESTVRNYDNTINTLNNYLKSKNKNERYFTFRDKIKVSEKAFTKIEKIISDDQNHLWERQN